MRDCRLRSVETIVKRQQRLPSEGDHDRLLLDGQDTDRGSFGPVLRSVTDLRAFHFAMVFGLTPKRLANALRLASLCCIARRIASVVVALPCKTWPIAHSSNHSTRMPHQRLRPNS